MADNYLGRDGDKRARELSEAWTGISGYADDTMMFVARYGHQCSVRLFFSFLLTKSASPARVGGKRRKCAKFTAFSLDMS
jgi:hypothetical protein